MAENYRTERWRLAEINIAYAFAYTSMSHVVISEKIFLKLVDLAMDD